MSLFKKFFKGQDTNSGVPSLSAQLQEADDDDAQDAKNASRRDMVQVVLRETMRRHGIPSNWIECRTMAMTTRGTGTGMHVQLIVRQGHDRLLTYIPAFQSGFLAGVEKFEPRAAEWLLSLSWQFDGMSAQNYETPPNLPLHSGAAGASGAIAASAAPALSEDDEIQEDLKALLAIRTAALQEPLVSAPDADRPAFGDTRPGH